MGIAAIFLTVVMILLAEPLLNLLQTPIESMEHAKEYKTNENVRLATMYVKEK